MDFIIAYNKTAKNEGGYANDPADHGGETWKGIARKLWPGWEGWPVVDLHRTDPGFPKSLYDIEKLELMVRRFYKTQFWDVMRGDELEDQGIANSIYDSAVNMGIVIAVRMAQNLVWGLPTNDAEKNIRIKELGVTYGKMDEKTLNKLNIHS